MYICTNTRAFSSSVSPRAPAAAAPRLAGAISIIKANIAQCAADRNFIGSLPLSSLADDSDDLRQHLRMAVVIVQRGHERQSLAAQLQEFVPVFDGDLLQGFQAVHRK